MTPGDDHHPTLATDGERLIPAQMQEDVEIEHWHRYALAAKFTAGKRVLDIASGEGYGSALLAEDAVHVVGVDISKEAITHAQNAYRRSNLVFKIGTCASIPLPDSSVDVVVSFETLEHHDQHVKMLQEIKRVVVPGGLCIISTPDRIIYSEQANYKNPFHVKELSTAEFDEIIGSFFEKYEIFGQNYSTGSLVLPLDKNRRIEFQHLTQSTLGAPPTFCAWKPKYLVAIASDSEIPAVQSSFLENTHFLKSHTEEVARIEQLIANTTQTAKTETEAYKSAMQDRIRERDSALKALEDMTRERDETLAVIAVTNAALQDRIHEHESVLQALENMTRERDQAALLHKSV